MLLLVLGNEENAFYILCRVTSGDIMPQYHVATMEPLVVDLNVLDRLVALKFPRITAQLNRMGYTLALVATKWFICGFIDSMPMEVSALRDFFLAIIRVIYHFFLLFIFINIYIYFQKQSMLRVWDSFLYEGSKILFRVSLALLKLNEDKICTGNDSSLVYNAIKVSKFLLSYLDFSVYFRFIFISFFFISLTCSFLSTGGSSSCY